MKLLHNVITFAASSVLALALAWSVKSFAKGEMTYGLFYLAVATPQALVLYGQSTNK